MSLFPHIISLFLHQASNTNKTEMEESAHGLASNSSTVSSTQNSRIDTDFDISGKLQPTTRGMSAKPAKKKSTTKFKKNPQAPKRFKSAFIIFSAEKHKEIRAEATAKDPAAEKVNVAKLVSEAWKKLPPEEKAHWEERAREDKARYDIEKATYKGPWKVPNQRRQKDPSAPRRPQSAFLAFSNSRRATMKANNPDASNAELSKILSKMWKEAPEDLRKKYVDEEAELRQQYHASMTEWKKKEKEEKEERDRQREGVALELLEAQQQLAEQPSTASQARSYPSDLSQVGHSGEISGQDEIQGLSPFDHLQSRIIDSLRATQRSLDVMPTGASVAAAPRSIEETKLEESLQSVALARLSASLGPSIAHPYQTALSTSYPDIVRRQLNSLGLPSASFDPHILSSLRSIEANNAARRLLEEASTASYYGNTQPVSLQGALGTLANPSLMARNRLSMTAFSDSNASILSQAADAMHRSQVDQNANAHPLDQFLNPDFRAHPRWRFG